MAGRRLTITVTLIADEHASPEEVGEYVFNLIGNDDDAIVLEIENYEVSP